MPGGPGGVPRASRAPRSWKTLAIRPKRDRAGRRGPGEVIARKAGYGRQLTVRSARTAGASWSQIGAALGTSKQSAWEAHNRWIDQQAEQHGRIGYQGMDEQEAAAARALAGPADDDQPG